MSGFVDEDLIIARDGVPVARVAPVRPVDGLPRVGFLPDIDVSADFDEMGSDMIAAAIDGQ